MYKLRSSLGSNLHMVLFVQVSFVYNCHVTVVRALLNVYLGKERSTNGKIILNAQIICLRLQIN